MKRILASTLRTVESGSWVVRGAWDPADVTRVLRKKARVLVWVGPMERRCVLVVMLLNILGWVAVVLRRKQYMLRMRLKLGTQVRGSRWERPGARGWAGITGMVVVV